MKKASFSVFTIRMGILLVAAIFSLSVCDRSSSTNSIPSVTSKTSSDRDTGVSKQLLTDGKILQVLYIHNNTEIRHGEQIANLSDIQELHANAQIIIDHYRLADEEIWIHVDSGVELRPTELSRYLEFQAEQNREHLADLR